LFAPSGRADEPISE